MYCDTKGCFEISLFLIKVICISTYSDWQGFLFCVKYYAALDDEDCPVSHLDEIGQQLDSSPGPHCFGGYRISYFFGFKMKFLSFSK